MSPNEMKSRDSAAVIGSPVITRHELVEHVDRPLTASSLETRSERVEADVQIVSIDHGRDLPTPALSSYEKATMAAAFGATWKKQNAELIASLPRGTVIAVNIDTSDYVTGRNGLEADDEFERVYGPTAIGWVIRVGNPIRLGGLAWRHLSGE